MTLQEKLAEIKKRGETCEWKPIDVHNLLAVIEKLIEQRNEVIFKERDEAINEEGGDYWLRIHIDRAYNEELIALLKGDD